MSFWSIQFYNEMHEKCWGEYGNFSFVELSYEYAMVSRLKEICRANKITLSIFFVEGT